MSQAMVSELEAAAKQSTAERVASEMAERAALFAVEKAKSAAGQAARRRSELTSALADAESLEAAEMDRLGKSRLALAGLEREIEAYSDKAAAGDLNAPKTIVRLNDTLELNRSLVVAHGRRVAAATETKEAAEEALATFDAVEASRIAAQREAIMVATAARIDALFADACPTLLLLAEMVDSYRTEHRPPEPWRLPWSLNTPHAHAQRALLPALARAEPGFDRLGPQLSRGAETLAKVIGDCAALWRSGRGETVAEPEPAPQGAA